MLSTQTLSQEIANLVSGNKIYNAYQDRWKFLLESYVGGEEYRQAGHLTRYQLETDYEYAARLKSTPLENHCASVVSVYNSFLFRKNPERDFSNNLESFELESFLRDADMDGRSLDAFMKDVATWSSVFGSCWIIVSKPNINAITRADELAQGVRPYVNLLTPLTVLDWTWTRRPSGKYELSYLRYLEDVNGDIHVVKEWTPETIRTATVDVKRSEIQEDIIEVNGLGKIPAVCAYNGRSTVRGIGISDLTDIADMQKFIYNATSEVDQSIRLDSHPSLVKTPETQAGIGAGSIIHMPENLDPGLKPYVLEFSGASVDTILRTIQHAVDTIDKMANTGSIRSTEARRMSGVAQQQEFELLNARLSEKADNLELAEEQMWQFWFEYQGEQWMGEVDYPGSFNIRDTDSEIQQLKVARDTATDPLVLKAIDYKILDWLGEDELAESFEQGFLEPTMETPPASLAQAQAELNSEEIVDGCPLPMMDKATNIANHKICVEEANLGPASPSRPGVFWLQRADRLGITEAESRRQNCANCGFYMDTQQIKDCWDKGDIPIETEINPSWEVTGLYSGYCLKYDITCTPIRTCDAWAPGGPITD